MICRRQRPNSSSTMRSCMSSPRPRSSASSACATRQEHAASATDGVTNVYGSLCAHHHKLFTNTHHLNNMQLDCKTNQLWCCMLMHACLARSLERTWINNFILVNPTDRSEHKTHGTQYPIATNRSTIGSQLEDYFSKNVHEQLFPTDLNQ